MSSQQQQRQRQNISRWLRENSEIINENRRAFPSQPLSANSTELLYNRYKQALRNLVATQRSQVPKLKDRIYQEAYDHGYRVSKSSSSVPKLKRFMIRSILGIFWRF
jgi:hypothetical protein